MTNQSKVFLDSEADAWFDRNNENILNNQSSVNHSRKILTQWCSSRKENISKILEIGAGNGIPLAYLADQLDADAYGIEPSSKAVKLWEEQKQFIQGGEKTNLQVGIASTLPFSNDKFDMVVFGFCLYLIDRKDLFQSISEADRVLKDGGLLAIIDFDPSKPYKNLYSHKQGIKSYKNNYSDIFLSSGHYALMYKHSYSHEGSTFHETVDERVSISLLFKQEEKVYSN